MHHAAPWWYRLARRLLPGRCREIPEAVNTDRIVLRQFAIWKRHAYLQQFASSEDSRYLHSHQWHWMLAIGLWGGYRERRIAGPDKIRKAPYIYALDASTVHHAQDPSPGHTSIFIGLWRDDSLKHYYGLPVTHETGVPTVVGPVTTRFRWEDHIQKMVERI